MLNKRKKAKLFLALAFLMLSSTFYVITAQETKNYCKDCGSLQGCYNETTIITQEGWRWCDYDEVAGKCVMKFWGPCDQPPI